MADDAEVENQSLAERLSRADYLSRELSEHLRQAYIPKLTALVRASREYDPRNVSDQQILDRTLAVLEADEFADDLYVRLRKHLVSIRAETSSMLFAQESSSSSFLAMPVFDADKMQD